MKTGILLLLLVQVYLPQSCSQANKYIVKGYAYSRETLGGAAPTVKIDENGTASERGREAGKQYYIYIEVTQPTDVVVQSVSINGKSYGAGITEAPVTPVVLSNPSVAMDTDTLVAKTPNKVWQVIPKTDSPLNTPTSSAAKSGAADGVEIVYAVKGKTFRYLIQQIKKLHPVALQ